MRIPVFKDREHPLPPDKTSQAMIALINISTHHGPTFIASSVDITSPQGLQHCNVLHLQLAASLCAI